MPKAEPRGLFVAKPWRFTQEMQVPGVPAQVRGLSAESHMEDAMQQKHVPSSRHDIS